MYTKLRTLFSPLDLDMALISLHVVAFDRGQPTVVQERFIWPLLSDYVGAGNQVMEFMSAAIVAHALNRTLCLSPFRDGPSRHFGKSSSDDAVPSADWWNS